MNKSNELKASVKKLESGKLALLISTSIKLPNAKHVRDAAVGITGKDASSRTCWIDVGPKGEWAGHSEGPFILDDATFDSIIKHFKKRKSSPQVDYGHGSLYETDGQPKPAAGYILDLAVENNRLWAKVEFTKRAATYIKNGEYRYCSGVFCWDAVDPESGDTVYAILDSIALTNRPFIDGQNPIMLSLNPNKKKVALTMKKEEFIKLISEIKDEEFTMEKAKEALDKAEAEIKEEKEMKKEEIATSDLESELAEEEGLAAEEESTEEAEEAAMADVPGDPLTALAEALALDVPTLVEKLMANLDAIKTILEGTAEASEEMEAMPASTVAALSQVKALTAEINKLRSTVKAESKNKSEEEVDALIKAGKLLPSAKADMVSLAKNAPKAFRALTNALPTIVPLGKDAPVAKPSKAPVLSSAVDEIPETHPQYVALAAQYSDPKNPYNKIVAGNPKMLDKFVRDALKRGTFGM